MMRFASAWNADSTTLVTTDSDIEIFKGRFVAPSTFDEIYVIVNLDYLINEDRPGDHKFVIHVNPNKGVYTEDLPGDSGILHVYPNPVTNFVNVDVDPARFKGATNVTLWDILGRKIRDVDVTPGYDKILWELNEPPGVYFVTAAANGLKVVRTFTILN